MPKEYIEREALLKQLEELNNGDNWIVNQYNADWIYSFIDAAPTADVVEVVRCKDCKFHTDEEPGMVYCPGILGNWVNENWYCADGEREDEIYT